MRIIHGQSNALARTDGTDVTTMRRTKIVKPAAKPRLLVILLAATLAGVCSCGSGGGGGGPTGPGTARELNSGDLGPADTYQHRFAAAGTFRYHCVNHSVMTGSVVVSDAAPDTLVTVSIVSSTRPFPAASVKPRGRVVWTNNDGMVHTVTSN